MIQNVIITTPEEIIELSSKINFLNNEFKDFKKNFNNKAQSEYFSRREVCKKLGISPATLHNWVKQKKLPVFGLGGKIFFRSEDIENAIVQLNK
jgi:excisionase family DNA binding protein